MVLGPAILAYMLPNEQWQLTYVFRIWISDSSSADLSILDVHEMEKDVPWIFSSFSSVTFFSSD